MTISNRNRGPVRRVLFVDAYDSFSCSIVKLLEDVLGAEVFFIRIDSSYTARTLPRLLQCFDAVVLGAGPGNPGSKSDTGLMGSLLEVAERDGVPVLGICLGFQVIGLLYGGEIERLKWPQHGQVSTVTHKGSSIFRGVCALRSTSYHSLHVKIYNQPPEKCDLWRVDEHSLLEPLAWNLDMCPPILMAAKHVALPFWGLQFHPESVCSNEENKKVILNWYEDSLRWNLKSSRCVSPDLPSALLHAKTDARPLCSEFVSIPSLQTGNRQMTSEVFSNQGLTVSRICELLSLPEQDVIVLESAALRQDVGTHSIIGVLLNDYWRVEYFVGDSFLQLIHSSGMSSKRNLDGIDVWIWLDRFMQSINIRGGYLEIPFWAGLMGMFSYEMGLQNYSISNGRGDTPDICLALVERSIVVDHRSQQIYVQSIIENDGWPKQSSHLLRCASCCHEQEERAEAQRHVALKPALTDMRTHLPNESEYKRKIRAAQESLATGDSYQLCLTDEVIIETAPSQDPCVPWHLYRSLCKKNAAPFAAYLSLGKLKILSSSPEQFLHRDRGGYSSIRPMKGTVRKSPDMTRRKAEMILATPKERAENLMIVDIIRHDLLNATNGTASVFVPELMLVEDLETVYTMSSRVVASNIHAKTGDHSSSAVGTLRDCLPVASMTGAPKKRSCEILRGLEQRPRRIYSGVLGYLDFSGAAQFSVLIRCAFRYGNDIRDVWRVGAGGGVTTLSTEEGEWDEMLAKVESVLHSFGAITEHTRQTENK